MTNESYELAVAIINFLKTKQSAMPSTPRSVTVASASINPYYTVIASADTDLEKDWSLCLLQFSSGPAKLTSRMVKGTNKAAKSIKINRKPRTGEPAAGNTAMLTAGPFKKATFSLAMITPQTMQAAFEETEPCHIHLRCTEDDIALKTMSPQRDKLSGDFQISKFEVWIYMSKSDALASQSLRNLPAVVSQVVEMLAQFFTTESEARDATLTMGGVGNPTFSIKQKTGSDPTAPNRPVIAAQIEFFVKFS